ncbi:transcriptional regulator [Aeromicrobium flavum]|uniref:Transcriptional regulator n=1 Tax=Aeromicrobium flavum TaxID=416568 RepID=A0A512HUF6_9ACTN|nr:GAF and ANTAR domain-containing protein [Aeromicrobium flavum]GEO89068.1 transcriptional regulator [Aeromicrobium flavum]
MTTESQSEQPVRAQVPPALDLAQIVLELHETHDSEHTIERVASYAVTAVACDDAGVMISLGRNRVETAGATGEKVHRAHELQIEFDEGPCLDVLEHPDRIHRVSDTTTDPRWPRWGAAVAGLGYRSVVSVPLAKKGHGYGSLNAYAERAQAFDADDVAVMTILARHASAALTVTHDLEGLRKAVDARKLIGIAMGMIMERYDIDADRAFHVLRRLSQAENVKLREVARQVVERRGLPAE